MNRIENKIKECLRMIASEQERDGGFLSLSSASLDFKNSKKYKTAFIASNILACIESGSVSEKILKYLLKEKSDLWTFNYWSRFSKEAKTMPYPDDLDDTFCALYAINRLRPEIIGGAELAKIVQVLTALEMKVGGPYKTWLVSNNAPRIWKDVDLAVNANVHNFMVSKDILLPRLKKYIDNQVVKKTSSPYYPDIFMPIYFVSRNYKGSKQKFLISTLLKYKKVNGSFGNSLQTAVAISSLINLGYSKEKLKNSIQFILNSKIDVHAFCIDPAINKVKHYAGSKALTAAFIIEALNKYKSTVSTEISQDLKEIAEQIHKEFKRDPKSRELQPIFDRVLKKDKYNQIILLPAIFNGNLKNGKVNKQRLVDLGLASLYGWMSYTLYDDFYDQEGDPKLLTLAEYCFKKLEGIYRSMGNKAYQLFNQTIVQMDQANLWELLNCRNINRIPEYGDLSQLADKSFGHALAPLVITKDRGYKEVRNFFKHYLICRQLNDDAHDWYEDLERGQVNAVAAMVLREWNKKLSIKRDKQNLELLFWNEIIKEVAKQVYKNANVARRNIKQVQGMFKSLDLFENLLAPLENSLTKALEQSRETKKFIKAYGK